MAPTKKTKVAPRKKSDVVKEGSVVKVHYNGTLDGKPFDSTEGKEPLEFAVGEHKVIPGFEKAFLGMKVGEKKTIEVPPEEGYGPVRDELRQVVPKKTLGDITPEKGMMLALQHPAAPQPIPAKVVKITKDEVELDMNHPLAGKTLTFDLEVVEIR
ncbi:MAG: peptidylprolyl isomerase [Candidatus Woesearchaeota archaeon]|nr:peptidylprolyl isomerase [Candidatus Woesearchaeota archaeon]